MLSNRPAAGTAVRLSGVTKTFADQPVLTNISFELAVGQTLVVFGSNGAGKSTLLNILATLIRPDSGQVSVLGHDYPGDGPIVRSKIGLVAHSPLLYRELSPRENLRFAADLYGVDHARIDFLLERVGLYSGADEPLHSLSRGMIQRVAICRGVIHDPAILLLDEPYANLDPAGVEKVEPLIKAIGTTRVIVTHSVDEGLTQGDQILCLQAGRQALVESADSLVANEVAAIYV